MEDAWFILFQLVVPICAIGLVANALVLILMFRGKLKSLSTSVYLVYLAIADMGCLLHALIEYSIHMAEMTYRTRQHPILCKMSIFFLATCALISSWILVAISVERIYVVIAPIEARIVNSRLAAAVIGGIISIFMVGVALVITFLGNDEKCKADVYYQGILNISLYSATPGVLVAILSVGIIAIVVRHYMVNNHAIFSHSNRNTDNLKKLTVMLLIRAVLFIVFTLPNTIISLYLEKIAPKDLKMSCFLLALMNHAGNPVLYTFSGALVREEFFKLCSNIKILFWVEEQQATSTSSSKQTSGTVLPMRAMENDR